MIMAKRKKCAAVKKLAGAVRQMANNNNKVTAGQSWLRAQRLIINKNASTSSKSNQLQDTDPELFSPFVRLVRCDPLLSSTDKSVVSGSKANKRLRAVRSVKQKKNCLKQGALASKETVISTASDEICTCSASRSDENSENSQSNVKQIEENCTEQVSDKGNNSNIASQTLSTTNHSRAMRGRSQVPLCNETTQGQTTGAQDSCATPKQVKALANVSGCAKDERHTVVAGAFQKVPIRGCVSNSEETDKDLSVDKLKSDKLTAQTHLLAKVGVAEPTTCVLPKTKTLASGNDENVLNANISIQETSNSFLCSPSSFKQTDEPTELEKAPHPEDDKSKCTFRSPIKSPKETSSCFKNKIVSSSVTNAKSNVKKVDHPQLIREQSRSTINYLDLLHNEEELFEPDYVDETFDHSENPSLTDDGSETNSKDVERSESNRQKHESTKKLLEYKDSTQGNVERSSVFEHKSSQNDTSKKTGTKITPINNKVCNDKNIFSQIGEARSHFSSLAGSNTTQSTHSADVLSVDCSYSCEFTSPSSSFVSLSTSFDSPMAKTPMETKASPAKNVVTKCTGMSVSESSQTETSPSPVRDATAKESTKPSVGKTTNMPRKSETIKQQARSEFEILPTVTSPSPLKNAVVKGKTKLTTHVSQPETVESKVASPLKNVFDKEGAVICKSATDGTQAQAPAKSPHAKSALTKGKVIPNPVGPKTAKSTLTKDKDIPNPSGTLSQNKPVPVKKAITKETALPNPSKAQSETRAAPANSALTKETAIANLSKAQRETKLVLLKNAFTKEKAVPNPSKAQSETKPVSVKNILTKEKAVSNLSKAQSETKPVSVKNVLTKEKAVSNLSKAQSETKPVSVKNVLTKEKVVPNPCREQCEIKAVSVKTANTKEKAGPDLKREQLKTKVTPQSSTILKEKARPNLKSIQPKTKSSPLKENTASKAYNLRDEDIDDTPVTVEFTAWELRSLEKSLIESFELDQNPKPPLTPKRKTQNTNKLSQPLKVIKSCSKPEITKPTSSPSIQHPVEESGAKTSVYSTGSDNDGPVLSAGKMPDSSAASTSTNNPAAKSSVIKQCHTKPIKERANPCAESSAATAIGRTFKLKRTSSSNSTRDNANPKRQCLDSRAQKTVSATKQELQCEASETNNVGALSRLANPEDKGSVKDVQTSVQTAALNSSAPEPSKPELSSEYKGAILPDSLSQTIGKDKTTPEAIQSDAKTVLSSQNTDAVGHVNPDAYVEAMVAHLVRKKNRLKKLNKLKTQSTAAPLKPVSGISKITEKLSLESKESDALSGQKMGNSDQAIETNSNSVASETHLATQTKVSLADSDGHMPSTAVTTPLHAVKDNSPVHIAKPKCIRMKRPPRVARLVTDAKLDPQSSIDQGRIKSPTQLPTHSNSAFTQCVKESSEYCDKTRANCESTIEVSLQNKPEVVDDISTDSAPSKKLVKKFADKTTVKRKASTCLVPDDSATSAANSSQISIEQASDAEYYQCKKRVRQEDGTFKVYSIRIKKKQAGPPGPGGVPDLSQNPKLARMIAKTIDQRCKNSASCPVDEGPSPVQNKVVDSPQCNAITREMSDLIDSVSEQLMSDNKEVKARFAWDARQGEQDKKSGRTAGNTSAAKQKNTKYSGETSNCIGNKATKNPGKGTSNQHKKYAALELKGRRRIGATSNQRQNHVAQNSSLCPPVGRLTKYSKKVLLPTPEREPLIPAYKPCETDVFGNSGFDRGSNLHDDELFLPGEEVSNLEGIDPSLNTPESRYTTDARGKKEGLLPLPAFGKNTTSPQNHGREEPEAFTNDMPDTRSPSYPRLRKGLLPDPILESRDLSFSDPGKDTAAGYSSEPPWDQSLSPVTGAKREGLLPEPLICKSDAKRRGPGKGRVEHLRTGSSWNTVGNTYTANPLGKRESLLPDPIWDEQNTPSESPVADTTASSDPTWDIPETISPTRPARYKQGLLPDPFLDKQNEKYPNPYGDTVEDNTYCSGPTGYGMSRTFGERSEKTGGLLSGPAHYTSDGFCADAAWTKPNATPSLQPRERTEGYDRGSPEWGHSRDRSRSPAYNPAEYRQNDPGFTSHPNKSSLYDLNHSAPVEPVVQRPSPFSVAQNHQSNWQWSSNQSKPPAKNQAFAHNASKPSNRPNQKAPLLGNPSHLHRQENEFASNPAFRTRSRPDQDASNSEHRGTAQHDEWIGRNQGWNEGRMSASARPASSVPNRATPFMKPAQSSHTPPHGRGTRHGPTLSTTQLRYVEFVGRCTLECLHDLMQRGRHVTDMADTAKRLGADFMRINLPRADLTDMESIERQVWAFIHQKVG